MKHKLPEEMGSKGGSEKSHCFLPRQKPRLGWHTPICSQMHHVPACWGPDLQEPAPSCSQWDRLFTLVLWLNLAKTVLVLLLCLCNPHSRAAGTPAGWAGGMCTPSMGYGAAGTLQDKAAARGDVGMQGEVGAPACSCSLVQMFNTWGAGKKKTTHGEINYQ